MMSGLSPIKERSMRRLACAAVSLSAVLTAATVLAQTPFDGTWKFTLQGGQVVQKDTMSLDKGMYRCDTCDPKFEIAADGQDHPVTGSVYADTTSAKVVSDTIVEVVSKKGGKIVSTVKMTASPDGKTLTMEWTQVAANGQTMSGKAQDTRVVPGPPGSHKISGTWELSVFQAASDNMMYVTFKSTPDGLSMSDRLGNSWDAKFDGKDYPAKGDPGTTSVSLKRINANMIEETDKRNGLVTAVARMTVSADGKTLTIEAEDKLHKSTQKFTASKQ
jgi:hypothetical protein